MRFRKWWHTMVAHDLAELSLVIVEPLRPLLHLFLKSHAPRRTHYISPEPTQPRARPEPRSYCIRFHRLVYGFPRRHLLGSPVNKASHRSATVGPVGDKGRTLAFCRRGF